MYVVTSRTTHGRGRARVAQQLGRTSAKPTSTDRLVWDGTEVASCKLGVNSGKHLQVTSVHIIFSRALAVSLCQRAGR